MKIKDNMTFEEALARLEDISDMLQSGEVALDEVLKLYEEGVKLSQECAKKLEEAELKFKEITVKDEALEK